MSLLMFALQSATPAVTAADAPKLQVTKPCAPATNGEIVVCGDRQAQEQYRLRPLPETYAEKPVRAQRSVSGPLTVAVDTEQKTILGVPSNRVMVRLKLPF